MSDSRPKKCASARRRLLQLTAATALAASFTPLHAAPHADPVAPTGRWDGNTSGSAGTPPMGWNSWNAFRTEVDEDKVMGAARVLVDSGLARLGYTYVNLDDGWWLKRRTGDGRLQIRTGIFPSAATGGPQGTSFRPFTDRIHAMGLKAGIYTDIGRNACSQASTCTPPTCRRAPPPSAKWAWKATSHRTSTCISGNGASTTSRSTPAGWPTSRPVPTW